MESFKVIRDPLWNNIQIDREVLGVLDSEPFQRLRYVRQLGHAFLVYPGATHTRFEHAIGTYHLARRTLGMLGERGELQHINDEELAVVRIAALLHDIGHYPFSHALEEAGLPSHEDLAQQHFGHPSLDRALTGVGISKLHGKLSRLITGTSGNPLGGLISGSLDLDKIEYLTRDARMCGVPYGAVDVDRLLHALTIVTLSNGASAVAIREKGLSALESLLFARYQMYRNVYWHHAVRSATAMFKRVARTAIARGHVTPEWIGGSTDEVLMQKLRTLAENSIALRLKRRHLYKRILELPGSAVPDRAGDWIAREPDLVEAVEDRLAAELGLGAGELLLDFPAKAKMLEVDLPLLTRSGAVEPLGGEEAASRLGIQGVAEQLHANARRLRVFTAAPHTLNARQLLGILERTTGELRDELAAKNTLLPTA